MLQHPNILQMHCAFEDLSGQSYLIMELGSGNLFDRIDRLRLNGRCMIEAEAAPLMLQICSAVSYMHQLDVCHRDLKSENLIFNGRDLLKVADFGSACFCD